MGMLTKWLIRLKKNSCSLLLTYFGQPLLWLKPPRSYWRQSFLLPTQSWTDFEDAVIWRIKIFYYFVGYCGQIVQLHLVCYLLWWAEAFRIWLLGTQGICRFMLSDLLKLAISAWWRCVSNHKPKLISCLSDDEKASWPQFDTLFTAPFVKFRWQGFPFGPNPNSPRSRQISRTKCYKCILQTLKIKGLHTWPKIGLQLSALISFSRLTYSIKNTDDSRTSHNNCRTFSDCFDKTLKTYGHDTY